MIRNGNHFRKVISYFNHAVMIVINFKANRILNCHINNFNRCIQPIKKLN